MHRLWHIALGLFVASGLACGGARAAVDSVGPNGFSLSQAVHIAAPPAKVYTAFTQPSHWWSAEHSYSHDATNFTLDVRAGGCWCEAIPGGGSVQHMVVVLVMPEKMIRLRGALGPFQALGVDGAWTVSFKPAADGGTEVTGTYNLGGYYKDGFAMLSQAGDGVLAEQFVRLKALVETGSPEPKEEH